MSAMKHIDIDPQTATAWVEAGVNVKDLDDVTCPQGLAAVNGSCTTVGVVGFTLGGGFGFLSRTKGLAVDNCLQMEIVTATGQRIVASSQDHRHLFWVLRGAGQVGYGVVTKLQVKLHTLQEQYFGGEGTFKIEATLRSIKKKSFETCNLTSDSCLIVMNIELCWTIQA